MEVILVLNGTMTRSPGFEHYPPKVETGKWGNDGFSIEYEWTVECEPKVLLKDVSCANMKAVKEIESTRG